MAIEYELKFQATPQQLAQIDRAFQEEGQTLSMETTYYDTPSGALSARHYTLRTRLENGVSVCTLKTPAGNAVPAYDLERTVCDVIRSRNRLGTETFLAALKLYAADPRKDLNKLNTYAKEMRVANILRVYLEVLL